MVMIVTMLDDGDHSIDDDDDFDNGDDNIFSVFFWLLICWVVQLAINLTFNV